MNENENRSDLNMQDEENTSIHTPEETVETEDVEIIEPEYDSAEACADAGANEAELERISKEIQAQLKTYKITLWGVVGSIGLYLVCLFMIKSNALLLATCVIMIVMAILNTRYSKRIQKLAKERAALQASIEKPESTAAAAAGEDGLQIGTVNTSDPVVTGVESLNELPKEYTVLDDVDFGDFSAEHVVVSPYGVALVGNSDCAAELNAVLQEIGVESPVFVYDPESDIETLAQNIQSEKIVALDEQQIMTICQKLLGLR